MTKSHELGFLKQQKCIIVSEFWRLEFQSHVWRAMCLLKPVQTSFLLSSGGLLAILLFLCCTCITLTLHLHMVVSLCSCPCFVSCYKDISRAELEACPIPAWIHLNYLNPQWPYYTIRSHSEGYSLVNRIYLGDVFLKPILRYRKLISTYLFWRDTI